MEVVVLRAEPEATQAGPAEQWLEVRAEAPRVAQPGALRVVPRVVQPEGPRVAQPGALRVVPRVV